MDSSEQRDELDERPPREDLEVDIKADPPIIDDLGMLRGIASYHLGNRVFLHTVERLPSGSFAGYIGISLPKDTSAGAGENEMTFLNYAPVGAIFAHPIENSDLFEVELPDRDALSEAARTRQQRENKHRASVVPPIKNLVEDRREMHYEKYSEYEPEEFDSLSELDLSDQEMFDYGFHRGASRIASLVDRSLAARMDAAYRGEKRWSEHDTRSVIDL